jgi:membrane protein required for colicin V production
MNWVDIVVGLVLLFFFVAGARKGFIREVTGLISIIVAFIVGISGAPIWSKIIEQNLKIPSSVATLVAFILIFILVFILIRALGNLLFKVVRATPLDALDRLGGSIIGIVKGVLIVSLVLILLGLFNLPLVVSQELNGSWSAAPLRTVAPSLYRFFKEAVPQMRSLDDVVGDSVEKDLSRGREKIRQKSSQIIDRLEDSQSKLEDSQSKKKASPSSESADHPDTH